MRTKDLLKDDMTLYVALAGMMMTATLGDVISVFILIVSLVLSAIIITRRRFKEKIKVLAVRTLAWVIGIAAAHFFLYLKIKYGL